jgi:hypothetical protein
VAKLYRGRGTKAKELRAFGRRYPGRGKIVYGRVIGKVKREQAAKRGGVLIEEVKRHRSHSSKGKPFIVRRHNARVRA